MGIIKEELEKNGSEDIAAFAIGVIATIMSWRGETVEGKLERINTVLGEYEEVIKDE